MACREAGAPLCAVFGMSERWPAGSRHRPGERAVPNAPASQMRHDQGSVPSTSVSSPCIPHDLIPSCP